MSGKYLRSPNSNIPRNDKDESKDTENASQSRNNKLLDLVQSQYNNTPLYSVLPPNNSLSKHSQSTPQGDKKLSHAASSGVLSTLHRSPLESSSPLIIDLQKTSIPKFPESQNGKPKATGNGAPTIKPLHTNSAITNHLSNLQHQDHGVHQLQLSGSLQDSRSPHNAVGGTDGGTGHQFHYATPPVKLTTTEELKRKIFTPPLSPQDYTITPDNNPITDTGYHHNLELNILAPSPSLMEAIEKGAPLHTPRPSRHIDQEDTSDEVESLNTYRGDTTTSNLSDDILQPRVSTSLTSSLPRYSRPDLSIMQPATSRSIFPSGQKGNDYPKNASSSSKNAATEGGALLLNQSLTSAPSDEFVRSHIEKTGASPQCGPIVDIPYPADPCIPASALHNDCPGGPLPPGTLCPRLSQEACEIPPTIPELSTSAEMNGSLSDQSHTRALLDFSPVGQQSDNTISDHDVDKLSPFFDRHTSAASVNQLSSPSGSDLSDLSTLSMPLSLPDRKKFDDSNKNRIEPSFAPISENKPLTPSLSHHQLSHIPNESNQSLDNDSKHITINEEYAPNNDNISAPHNTLSDQYSDPINYDNDILTNPDNINSDMQLDNIPNRTWWDNNKNVVLGVGAGVGIACATIILVCLIAFK